MNEERRDYRYMMFLENCWIDSSGKEPVTSEKAGMNTDGLLWTKLALPSYCKGLEVNAEELWQSASDFERKTHRETDSVLVARRATLELPAAYELTDGEQKELLDEFTERQFLKKGMCADISVYRENRTMTAVLFLTVRPILSGGGWSPSSEKKIMVRNGKYGQELREETVELNWWESEKLHRDWSEAWNRLCHEYTEKSKKKSAGLGQVLKSVFVKEKPSEILDEETVKAEEKTEETEPAPLPVTEAKILRNAEEDTSRRNRPDMDAKGHLRELEERIQFLREQNAELAEELEALKKEKKEREEKRSAVLKQLREQQTYDLNNVLQKLACKSEQDAEMEREKQEELAASDQLRILKINLAEAEVRKKADAERDNEISREYGGINY